MWYNAYIYTLIKELYYFESIKLLKNSTAGKNYTGHFRVITWK